jgi:hypothetical protein
MYIQGHTLHIHGPNEGPIMTTLPAHANVGSQNTQLCWSSCGIFILVFVPSNMFIFRHHRLSTSSCSLVTVSPNNHDLVALEKKIFPLNDKTTFLPCQNDIFNMQSPATSVDNSISFHCVYSNATVVTALIEINDGLAGAPDTIKNIGYFDSKAKLKSTLAAGAVVSVSKCLWLQRTRCLILYCEQNSLNGEAYLRIFNWSIDTKSSARVEKYGWESVGLVKFSDIPLVDCTTDDAEIEEPSYIKNILPDSVASMVFRKKQHLTPVTQMIVNPSERYVFLFTPFYYQHHGSNIFFYSYFVVSLCCCMLMEALVLCNSSSLLLFQHTKSFQVRIAAYN